ncbi:hypothetical protein TNCV_923121 [Trichonephila clavipes]|nr:hypothetical protein TNCV_923121 [Trichonephila clavipes]
MGATLKRDTSFWDYTRSAMTRWVAWLVFRWPSAPKVAGSTPALVGGFSWYRKSTAAMSYDHTTCKRSQECLFGLGALGKINFEYRFASSELMCLPLGGKLGVKITCGDWYPLTRCLTKKRYQLQGNILGLQWEKLQSAAQYK